MSKKWHRCFGSKGPVNMCRFRGTMTFNLQAIKVKSMKLLINAFRDCKNDAQKKYVCRRMAYSDDLLKELKWLSGVVKRAVEDNDYRDVEDALTKAQEIIDKVEGE